MLEYQLKQLIKSRPEIKLVTNRGLETEDRKVVFYAKDLLSRFPNLMDDPEVEKTTKKKKLKAS